MRILSIITLVIVMFLTVPASDLKAYAFLSNEDILKICPDNLRAMFKSSDLVPRCVTDGSFEKLIQRGYGTESKTQSPIQIQFSMDHVECYMICGHDFTVYPDKITTTIPVYHEYDEVDPSIHREIIISDHYWNKLTGLIDFDEIDDLPNVIGCPGCADGSIVNIEIFNGTHTTGIKFGEEEYYPGIENILPDNEYLRGIENIFPKNAEFVRELYELNNYIFQLDTGF